MRRHHLAIASALLCFTLAGCGGGTGKSMIGKWQPTNSADAVVWEFANDGSVLMGNTRGTYTAGAQGRVKIQTPYATFVPQVQVTAERMRWTNPDGTTQEFVRVK